MRSEMLAVLRSDYIRMAQAKGVPAAKVVFKHRCATRWRRWWH